MIRELEDGVFVISSRQMWLPGIYATAKAARYAFQFSDAELQEMEARICHVNGENRPITTADLLARRHDRLTGARVGSGLGAARGGGPG